MRFLDVPSSNFLALSAVLTLYFLSRSSAETITRALYPNDESEAGKELRLKQQYLWCAASLQDILRRFKKLEKGWEELSDFVAIQLNESVSPVSSVAR